MADSLPPDSSRTEPGFPPPGGRPPAGNGGVAGRDPHAVKPWEREMLEKVLMAGIREQRAARRWKIFFRLLTLAIFALIVWSIFDFDGASTSTGSASGKHTALVTLTGEISPDGQASASKINSALESAFEDSSAAGVILRINSPGGSPVQAGMIYDDIARLRAKYPKKPLYVVVEEICASGGYYVAAAADKIYVDKASIVGSIGVLMDGFGFTGLMDKLGVERRLLTAGRNKGFLDPFSPQTEQQKTYALDMLEQVHQQFIGAVKKGRGNRLKDDPDLFSGLFWTGQRAVDLGLADGLGTVDSVARDVLKAPDLVDYTVKENLPERVARRFGAAVGEAAMKTMMMGSALTLK
ncbi:S49 family peptidase [Pandoraea nosoerga]|uniref:Peptidase S49 n=1 Tax=Pandoraea nosoerga TaxID=2508296 RepID=A0A5E4SVQ6_9BURK|nr:MULTISPECIES: S49 family peptidase [Pandoraea]MBN4665676.1 S49 family peptidase [Pandoraea nosoerga]MBN4675625.1 S49 family peptidase [Pandoraea nosoerga]MBN4680992.1 S49 family peptidase [Pandoraea nosoerga]MBN4744716.1 S49 family peptidase [Pandoraea nosoerga]VVD80006.1 peptidase S49 [Pandoraea nosoerga]